MIPWVHKAAGALALLMIALFWSATLVSELFLGEAAVVTVKTLIPYGFALLVPAIAATGGSGLALAKGRRAGLVGIKRKRMPWIAANGLVVLVPAALFLATRARAGTFDALFYVVQAIELIAGAANLALLGRNVRDGRRMTAGRRRHLKAA